MSPENLPREEPEKVSGHAPEKDEENLINSEEQIQDNVPEQERTKAAINKLLVSSLRREFLTFPADWDARKKMNEFLKHGIPGAFLVLPEFQRELEEFFTEFKKGIFENENDIIYAFAEELSIFVASRTSLSDFEQRLRTAQTEESGWREINRALSCEVPEKVLVITAMNMLDAPIVPCECGGRRTMKLLFRNFMESGEFALQPIQLV